MIAVIVVLFTVCVFSKRSRNKIMLRNVQMLAQEERDGKNNDTYAPLMINLKKVSKCIDLLIFDIVKIFNFS